MGGPGSGGNHGGGRPKKTAEEKTTAKAAKAAKLKADNAGKTPWTHCAKRRRVEEVEEVEDLSQELELEVGEMNSAANELAQTAAGVAAINLAPEAKGTLSNFTHEFASALHKEGLHLTNRFNSMLSQQYQGIETVLAKHKAEVDKLMRGLDEKKEEAKKVIKDATKTAEARDILSKFKHHEEHILTTHVALSVQK